MNARCTIASQTPAGEGGQGVWELFVGLVFNTGQVLRTSGHQASLLKWKLGVSQGRARSTKHVLPLKDGKTSVSDRWVFLQNEVKWGVLTCGQPTGKEQKANQSQVLFNGNNCSHSSRGPEFGSCLCHD